MNNPIFIFSLNSISNVDSITVFWKTTLSTSRPQNFVFSSFFLRVECGRVLKLKPKQTAPCTPFCGCTLSNQCNRPDLLETRWSSWGQCMCCDWWISILGLSQFFCVRGLSILAVILIKGNEKRKNKRWKGKQIRLNTIDKNKEQVDFVHKPN